MFTSKTLPAAFAAVALVAACSSAMSPRDPAPKFGRTAAAEEIAAWDISIPPDGEGLPAGGGTAKQGAGVYAAKCAACHGEKGQGKPADPLAGGVGSLRSPQPVRTVASYWPYATTLFDYVRRAMPLTQPMSLTNDEVYAVSAYILYLSGIVGEETPINAQTLPLVKMPNRDGFISAWRAEKR